MARLEIDVAHTLTPEDALARLQALGEFYENKHNAELTWRGASVSIAAKYLGVKIEATAHIRGKSVHAETRDLGFLLRKVGADYLRKKLTRYLDASTPIESLPRR